MHVYWVEVTLDNSERKIPIDARDVTIKRQYNCGTDREDYYVNGNLISQRDLSNLLESANVQTKFQIVEQGKVQQLVEKGEHGFLEMLRECTGVTADKKSIEQLMKSFEESQKVKRMIGSVQGHIETKLKKLGEEIETFNGYDQIDKEKKALERCLYQYRIQLNNT